MYFHLRSGINIGSRLINYVFSSFVFRKQREIVPLRFKDRFVELC